MKKLLVLGVFAAFAVISTRADIIYPDGTKPAPEPAALKKISRGLANIILAPIEIPKSIFQITSDEGVLSPEPISLGLCAQGPYKTAVRAAAGAYDLGTFWKDDSSLLHLEPDILYPTDALPGFPNMFNWETIGTGNTLGALDTR